MTSLENPNARLYLRFVDALNRRDYHVLNDVMAQDFTDHHPGLVDVTQLDVYKDNLAHVVNALDMKAIPQEVVGAGDRVFTRIKLTGRHLDTFLGVAPTGKDLTWHTNELWRVEDARLAERWAVDDLVGLLRQMGVPLPSWQ
jgi:predicted ester cyclase